MSVHPLIKVLNNLLFNIVDVKFEDNNSLKLSPSFIESFKLLKSHKVSDYWVEQIEKTIHGLERLERTSILQSTLNEDLFKVVLVKTTFEIYPKHIDVNSFDLAKDGYKFVFNNLPCEVITYLVYELIYKCTYDQVSLIEDSLSKEKYTTLCNLVSQTYNL
ncbi:hypothetical protein HX049_16945 [Myroides odoratimimus]|uniref:hypothetical protein n=1 Tax=Myroides odoratimimus TaxID=76832 RepID=UPI002575B489|nr:hypothetical protein [Myroides odoratimimus]MDM1398832.1 hypothetical protein [Myroides odoratimimus]